MRVAARRGGPKGKRRPPHRRGELQQRDRVGAALARETGLPTATLDPVATGPDAAPPDYYETAMRQNMEVLRATLGVQP